MGISGTPPLKPYTSDTRARFLGWTKAKAKHVLEELGNIERGTVPEKVFKGLSLKEAEQTSREASKTYRAVKAEAKVAGLDDKTAEIKAKNAAKDVAQEVASKLRTGKASTGQASTIGTEARRRHLKDSARAECALPDINERAKELARQINLLLSMSSRVNDGQLLSEIIKHKEFQSSVVRGVLATAIERLCDRSQKFLVALVGNQKVLIGR